MVKGIIYNPNVEELAKEQSGYMERLWEFNQLKPSEGRQESQIYEGNFRRSHHRFRRHNRRTRPRVFLPGRKNRRGESQINQDKFRKYKIFVK